MTFRFTELAATMFLTGDITSKVHQFTIYFHLFAAATRLPVNAGVYYRAIVARHFSCGPGTYLEHRIWETAVSKFNGGKVL